MEFRVVNRGSPDILQWDNLARHGSFFHTVSWSDVCVDGLAPRARAVFLCGYDNHKLLAGMPGIITRRLGIRSFYSMPDGTYGAPVFTPDCPPEFRRAFLNVLAGYLKQNKFSRIVIADFEGSLQEWRGHKMQRTGHFTHIVNLESQENLQPHKKIQYDIRSGQKVDSEIVRLETPTQVRDFYHLYCLTAERHESHGPRREEKFFKALFSHLHDSDRLYWTGLMAEGGLTGSQIHFIHGDTLFNWQTVSDYDKRQYKPSQLLMNDAISKAAALGLKKVNLGASPPEAAGLIRYKERWQGTRVEYDILSARSRLRKLIGR